VRCVVITGAGKAFCAGQDIAEINSPNPPTFTAILDDGYGPIVQKIRNMPKPVVAAVNGVAAGAGANIALACDIVVATQSASFIQAFSKIGLIPDSGGTYTLPRLVGLARATALMMTGEKVSAQQAEAMGMIYKCVPDEVFMATVEQLSQTLSMMPTKALGIIKRSLDASATNSFDGQLALETHLQGEAADSHDYREGIAAFTEKRAPRFIGK
jgi:2-(1,2-epoxy-1,2-dihydrophenyl)acetyl-CoA isomerase